MGWVMVVGMGGYVTGGSDKWCFFYKTKLPCAVCPVTAPYTPFGGTRAHRRPISNQNPVSIGNRK